MGNFTSQRQAGRCVSDATRFAAVCALAVPIRCPFHYVVKITGKYVRFQLPSAKIFTKVSQYFDAGGNAGNWKWQGSNDGSSWTDIGGNYQWNDNPNSAGWYEYTTMSGNTTAYTYYQVIGVSGNGDAGFNNTEIKFYSAAIAAVPGKVTRVHATSLAWA